MSGKLHFRGRRSNSGRALETRLNKLGERNRSESDFGLYRLGWKLIYHFYWLRVSTAWPLILSLQPSVVSGCKQQSVKGVGVQKVRVLPAPLFDTYLNRILASNRLSWYHYLVSLFSGPAHKKKYILKKNRCIPTLKERTEGLLARQFPPLFTHKQDAMQYVEL
jgi:hypothetical protein